MEEDGDDSDTCNSINISSITIERKPFILSELTMISSTTTTADNDKSDLIMINKNSPSEEGHGDNMGKIRDTTRALHMSCVRADDKAIDVNIKQGQNVNIVNKNDNGGWYPRDSSSLPHREGYITRDNDVNDISKHIAAIVNSCNEKRNGEDGCRAGGMNVEDKCNTINSSSIPYTRVLQSSSSSSSLSPLRSMSRRDGQGRGNMIRRAPSMLERTKTINHVHELEQPPLIKRSSSYSDGFDLFPMMMINTSPSETQPISLATESQDALPSSSSSSSLTSTTSSTSSSSFINEKMDWKRNGKRYDNSSQFKSGLSARRGSCSANTSISTFASRLFQNDIDINDDIFDNKINHNSDVGVKIQNADNGDFRVKYTGKEWIKGIANRLCAKDGNEASPRNDVMEIPMDGKAKNHIGAVSVAVYNADPLSCKETLSNSMNHISSYGINPLSQMSATSNTLYNYSGWMNHDFQDKDSNHHKRLTKEKRSWSVVDKKSDWESDEDNDMKSSSPMNIVTASISNSLLPIQNQMIDEPPRSGKRLRSKEIDPQTHTSDPRNQDDNKMQLTNSSLKKPPSGRFLQRSLTLPNTYQSPAIVGTKYSPYSHHSPVPSLHLDIANPSLNITVNEVIGGSGDNNKNHHQNKDMTSTVGNASSKSFDHGSGLSSLQPRPKADYKTPTRDNKGSVISDSDASIHAESLQKKGIKMVIIDFDKTFIKIHTKGYWRYSADLLRHQVRPIFLSLIPAILEKGIGIGVATFSPQEELIGELLSSIFGAHVKIGENVFIKGSGGELVHSDDSCASEPLPNLVSSSDLSCSSWEDAEDRKKRHIECLRKAYGAKLQNEVSNSSIIFIDDDAENVRAAIRDGVHGIWFRCHDICESIAEQTLVRHIREFNPHPR